jgi:hypothetical protein
MANGFMPTFGTGRGKGVAGLVSPVHQERDAQKKLCVLPALRKNGSTTMITAAAIVQGGRIFAGKPGVDRHHNLIGRIVKETGIRPVNGEQGFVDHTGRFLNRKDAGKHALECGQVIDGHANIRHEYNSRLGLFSEDLW